MNSHSISALSKNDACSDMFYVPSFHFDPVKPCYCQSGKVFGQCCGGPRENFAMPRGIQVLNGFLSNVECKRFTRFADKQKRGALSVVDGSKTTSDKTTHKRHNSRITQTVALGKKQQQASEWFYSACSTKLEALTGKKPQWFETPHLLRYGPGGKYDIHSDAEHFDSQSRQFYRFIDRDFSMLIYLNDDFVGGELNFPWLNFQYKPVVGDLVFFPSNHIFTHESLPIISGKKYALVSWGAFEGSPRVRQPRSMIAL